MNSHKYDNIDLTGQRHEKLIVIKKADKGRTQWICKCDCGKIVTLPAFRFFEYKSCGCLERENRENLSKHTMTHGLTNTILYSKYCSMKERCTNPNYKYFHRYGGRGIKVCEEWLGKNGFINFYNWAIRNGYDSNKKGYEQSLDRINVDGNYEPNNCRWANQQQQMRNYSKTKYIKCKNEILTLCDFCDKYNVSRYFARRRIEKNQDAETIIRDWNMLHNTPDNYMDVKQCAKFYNTSKETIMNWIRKNKIKAEKYGQKWYIPKGQPYPY